MIQKIAEEINKMKRLEILAHRGLWNELNLSNSIESLYLALSKGYGVEFDLRDYRGEIVISHDIADELSPTFHSFLDMIKDFINSKPLALNVKADGLQNLLIHQLQSFNLSNYFLFDMSFPETIKYRRLNLNYFTRVSDYECYCYDAKSSGLWVDCFESDFTNFNLLQSISESGKQFVFVSPELHKRPHLTFWKSLKVWLDQNPIEIRNNTMICTDFPERADEYFNE